MVDLSVLEIKEALKTGKIPVSPPKLKVGDVVKIKSDRKNKDFVGYNGTIGIVEQVYEFSADIRVWRELIPQVHFQFLQLIEGDLVTLKVTISQSLLRNLMVTFDRLEDSITSDVR